MNINRFSLPIKIALTALTGSLSLQSTPFVHSDIRMDNIGWHPAAGTLTWLTDWELNASALAFDTVNGSSGESNFGGGHPASVTANAPGGLSSAFAQVTVDGSGDVISLESSMDLTFPSGAFDSAFPAASAYREFMITGGSGPVNVTFSFDYLGHIHGDAPNQGADFRSLLSISSLSDTFDLSVFAARVGPTDATFSGPRSLTLPLEYGVAYGLTASVDGDPHVPDLGPSLALTGLVLFSLLFVPRVNRKNHGLESHPSIHHVKPN